MGVCVCVCTHVHACVLSYIFKTLISLPGNVLGRQNWLKHDIFRKPSCINYILLWKMFMQTGKEWSARSKEKGKHEGEDWPCVTCTTQG